MARPPQPRAGQTARVHLEFRVDHGSDTHWNNEVGGLVVWLDPPENVDVDRRRFEVAPPPEPASDEVRRVEFDVRAPAGPATTLRIPGYAVYYVVLSLWLWRRSPSSET